MLKKKFRLKIVHYAEDKYVLKYSYWYIPIYHTLYEFLDSSKNLYGYNPVLGDAEELSNFAQQFKSIEDIRKFQNAEETSRRLAVRKYNREWEEAVPYNSKRII